MGSLFKKPKPAPPAPMPSLPPPIPEPDTTSVLEAKKRNTDAAMQRAGRASTILTSDYGNTKLGGL